MELDLYTGIDILEVGRFREALGRNPERLPARLFTDRELASFPPEERDLYMCYSFSFKESVWKALPDTMQKGVYARDIEVVWKGGKPEILLRRERLESLAVQFLRAGENVITIAVLVA